MAGDLALECRVCDGDTIVCRTHLHTLGGRDLYVTITPRVLP